MCQWISTFSHTKFSFIESTVSLCIRNIYECMELWFLVYKYHHLSPVPPVTLISVGYSSNIRLFWADANITIFLSDIQPTHGSSYWVSKGVTPQFSLEQTLVLNFANNISLLLTKFPLEYFESVRTIKKFPAAK